MSEIPEKSKISGLAVAIMVRDSIEFQGLRVGLSISFDTGRKQRSGCATRTWTGRSRGTRLGTAAKPGTSRIGDRRSRTRLRPSARRRASTRSMWRGLKMNPPASETSEGSLSEGRKEGILHVLNNVLLFLAHYHQETESTPILPVP